MNTSTAQTNLNEKGTVNIRGVNHYYEWIRTPSENNSPKPVMVFIHGWGGLVVIGVLQQMRSHITMTVYFMI